MNIIAKKCAVPLILLAVATPAIAIDYNAVWIGPLTGYWHDVSHWSTGTIPANSRLNRFFVTIDDPRDAYTVMLGDPTSITSLFVGSNDVLDISYGANLTVASQVSGGGTINTANYSSLFLLSGLLEGITHTGDLTGALDVTNGVVRNVTNSSGILRVTDSQLDGTITNNAQLIVSGEWGSFTDATLGGVGALTGDGSIYGYASLYASDAVNSTLTIAGDQTLTGNLVTSGGSVIVNGQLNVAGGSSGFYSDVAGTGTINTINGSDLQVVTGSGVSVPVSLSGITHTGDQNSALYVLESEVRNVTNSSGFMVVSNSLLDGTITNNADLILSGELGGFANATIDGIGALTVEPGNVSGYTSLYATDVVNSTLTIAGDQTLTGNLVTSGGSVIVNGQLNVAGGSSGFYSDVTGTGTINTINGSDLQVVTGSGVSVPVSLSGITHTGDQNSALYVLDSDVRNITNSSGFMVVSNSLLDGTITNNADLILSGELGGFANATIDGIGALTVEPGNVSGYTSLYATDVVNSTLTIAGDQTLTGNLVTSGGSVIVNGQLNVAGGSSGFYSDVAGTGTINTINGSDLQVVTGSGVSVPVSLSGITHTGDQNSALYVLGSEVRNVTNSSGFMVVSNSLLDGTITNNADLILSGELGGFANATIDGIGALTVEPGNVSGYTSLYATDVVNSTLTIAGDQTLTGNLVTSGGSVIVNGQLNVAGGSSGFYSDVTGTGTINTINGSDLQVVTGSGVSVPVSLSGITHTGDQNSALYVLDSEVRNVTNSSGFMVVSNSLLDGTITNNADLILSGELGGFANATIDGIGALTVEPGNVSGYTSLYATDVVNSTLTIAGDQTLTGNLVTSGGSVIVNGQLNVAGGSSGFYSDVTGTGTINTINGSDLQVVTGSGVSVPVSLSGITHTGDGGSVLNVDHGVVRNVINSSGNLQITDSTLQEQVINQQGATLVAGNTAALININNGAHLINDGAVDGSLFIGDGGVLSGSGRVSRDLEIVSGGFFVSDNLTDTFTVTGTATLGGELQFDWYNGDPSVNLFTPVAGDVFDILYAETIRGEFDLLTMAILGNALTWDLSYILDDLGTDIVRLSIIEAPAVPIPAAVWLFGSGLLVLFSAAKRRAGA